MRPLVRDREAAQTARESNARPGPREVIVEPGIRIAERDRGRAAVFPTAATARPWNRTSSNLTAPARLLAMTRSRRKMPPAGQGHSHSGLVAGFNRSVVAF